MEERHAGTKDSISEERKTFDTALETFLTSPGQGDGHYLHQLFTAVAGKEKIRRFTPFDGVVEAQADMKEGLLQSIRRTFFDALRIWPANMYVYQDYRGPIPMPPPENLYANQFAVSPVQINQPGFSVLAMASAHTGHLLASTSSSFMTLNERLSSFAGVYILFNPTAQDIPHFASVSFSPKAVWKTINFFIVSSPSPKFALDVEGELRLTTSIEFTVDELNPANGLYEPVAIYGSSIQTLVETIPDRDNIGWGKKRDELGGTLRPGDLSHSFLAHPLKQYRLGVFARADLKQTFHHFRNAKPKAIESASGFAYLEMQVPYILLNVKTFP
jgi:hypothetical protein